MSRRTISLACLGLVWAVPVSAETGLSLDVSSVISPNNPSTTLELWAHFDEQPYAFGAAEFDMSATPDSGGFSDPFSVLHTLGTFDGGVQPDGDSVR